MKNLLTSFQSNVSKSKEKNRIEVSKFNNKYEVAKAWMFSFEKACEIIRIYY